MAHNLTNANGKYEFAYAGSSPWHNLGQHLAAEATKDDIMKAAGLEWTVLPEPLYLGNGAPVPGWVANVRSDTQETLGVVSTEYRLVQNGEAFSFVDLLANSAGAKYHTAGSVRRGRQVFASAKLPKTLVVIPNDTVDQYLLLVNSHDGTSGFHLRWVTIRVVCDNTLTAAMRGFAQYQYTVTHRGDLNAQIQEARRALGMAERYFEVAGQTYKALASKQITAMEMDVFTNSFMPLPTLNMTADQATRATTEEERTRIYKARDAMRALFEDGAGTEIPGVRGTAWGAYNAATEWIDRVRSTKKDNSPRANGAEAAILGIGQDLRNNAMKSALALL